LPNILLLILVPFAAAAAVAAAPAGALVSTSRSDMQHTQQQAQHMQRASNCGMSSSSCIGAAAAATAACCQHKHIHSQIRLCVHVTDADCVWWHAAVGMLNWQHRCADSKKLKKKGGGKKGKRELCSCVHPVVCCLQVASTVVVGVQEAKGYGTSVGTCRPCSTARRM
jgi:hypothetical protein